MIKLKNILTKILEVICVIMFAFITIERLDNFIVFPPTLFQ